MTKNIIIFVVAIIAAVFFWKLIKVAFYLLIIALLAYVIYQFVTGRWKL